MLYSMTGYGKAEGLLSKDKHLLVEIKSLNGKSFDFGNRFPALFRLFETDIRKILQQALIRGTIDMNLTLKQNGSARPVTINKELAGYYFKAMQEMSVDLSLKTTTDLTLQTIMALPEVVSLQSESLEETDWESIEKCILQAVEHLMAYRKTEGAAIEADLLKRVDNIVQLLTKVPPLEAERIQRIRQRIHATLEDLGNGNNLDENRFEQELIYYLEKIDFSEEKQRLAAHCNYFKQLIANGEESGIGKKLGFVLQEIGREINTLGSKANDVAIQKIVINMKDELEKAKEQILNVL